MDGSEIILAVHVRGQHETFNAAVTIPAVIIEQFDPIKSTNSTWLGFVTGDVLEGSVEITKRTRMREDAAADISRELTKMIIDAMKVNDTKNGYKHGQQ
jgi:hypothetical protein